MIEARIRNYLMAALTEPVYIDVPAEPPSSYVTVERTGGGEEEHIRSAMVALQSYGSSKLEAATLHENVMAAMKQFNERDDISACDLNSEYDYTDTTTHRYRYQAVFDIIYY